MTPTTTRAPQLSVIIATHNNRAVLQKCLECWQRFAADAPVELLVVEDGCTDGTAEYLALWFKSVSLESGFYWYTTAVIACTLVVCWFMRDTSAQSKIDAEARGQ